MTQKQRILKHLKQFGSITGAEAASRYGIMRLAARAQEMGLISTLINGRNRYDAQVVFAEYRLGE